MYQIHSGRLFKSLALFFERDSTALDGVKRKRR